MSALEDMKKYMSLYESVVTEKSKTKKEKIAWTEDSDDDDDSEEISEKWDTDTTVSPSEKGKYDDWTLEKLHKEYNEIKDKKDKTEEEKGRMHELQFAIRAKQKDQWGSIDESIMSVASRLMEEFGKSGKFYTMGKEFSTKVFPSDAAANKFLEDNDDWGVIGVSKGEVHVARNDDDGKKVDKDKYEETVSEGLDDLKQGIKRMWHGTDEEASDERDTADQYNMMKGDTVEKEKLKYAKENGSIVYDSDRYVVFEFGSGNSYQAFDKHMNYDSVIASAAKHPHLAKTISHSVESGNHEPLEKALNSYFNM